MRVHRFEQELWLPRKRREVFTFFSDARNLDAITPEWLSFRTISTAPVEMKVGAVIDYRLRVHGIPLRWRSRITQWEPPSRFADAQTRGPYRLWLHEHEFGERDGGTLVRDKVRYAVPFDFLLHKLFVRADVEKIFAYRARKLRELFSDETRQ